MLFSVQHYLNFPVQFVVLFWTEIDFESIRLSVIQ